MRRQSRNKKDVSILQERETNAKPMHRRIKESIHNAHPSPLITPQSGTRDGCAPTFLYREGGTIRLKKDQAQETEIKTGPWDISNNNDSDVHEGHI